MRFFKIILPLVLIAAIILTLAGCHRTIDTPKTTASPSASPKATAGTTAGATSSPSSSPMTTDGAKTSASPSGSPDASGMPAGEIEGFVEGMVINPDDVPHLTEVLGKHSEYQGLAIQSITYKLFEGRQAYYVVLQGEGDASRTLYVFADDSITEG